jgi:anthranilate phosphoribosyltransferase
LTSVGVGFMFAQVHHQRDEARIGPRRDMGLRTLFNMLGPLTNPAGVRHQVLGVFNKALCRPLAEVLQRLGSVHVLVVHSQDGLDEISLAAPTHVAELKDGCGPRVRCHRRISASKSDPDRPGSGRCRRQSLALIRDALGRRKTEAGRKAGDMIALNAGAATVRRRFCRAASRRACSWRRTRCTPAWHGKNCEELVSFTAVFRQENAGMSIPTVLEKILARKAEEVAANAAPHVSVLQSLIRPGA